MKRLNDKTEKRRNNRYTHISAVVRESLEIGTVAIGQMQNYSMGGFYFESNTLISPGDVVFLGLANSPYISEPKSYECHRVKVKWRKDVVHSRYRFAYGVQHLDPIGVYPEFTERYYCDIPKYLKLISAVNRELRKSERKSLTKSIYFTAHNLLFKGLIRDVSRRGIFIESKHQLKIGQIIRLVIPGSRFDNGVMIKAQIVHRTMFGFGVKLLSILKTSD